VIERITQDNCVGPARYGHEFRYRLAAGFIERGDTVLDAACGTGYGYQVLRDLGSLGDYIGVDRLPKEEVEVPFSRTDLHRTIAILVGMGVEYLDEDLTTWFPSWDFDVFLGFETIEHLLNYRNYIDIAHQAGKWVILSTPVVPTLHLNPHHVHDFASGDLQKLFEDEEWEHYQTVQQPSELSEITILRRRT